MQYYRWEICSKGNPNYWADSSDRLFHHQETAVGKRKMEKLMSITMTLFGVMFLSSFIYSVWDMEKFLLRLTMMILILVLLGITGIYLDVVFIRAVISYKKKRGNQRIEEQPNKSCFDKRKEVKERIGRGEVRIILGGSNDNDDN